MLDGWELLSAAEDSETDCEWEDGEHQPSDVSEPSEPSGLDQQQQTQHHEQQQSEQPCILTYQTGNESTQHCQGPVLNRLLAAILVYALVRRAFRLLVFLNNSNFMTFARTLYFSWIAP